MLIPACKAERLSLGQRGYTEAAWWCNGAIVVVSYEGVESHYEDSNDVRLTRDQWVRVGRLVRNVERG